MCICITFIYNMARAQALASLCSQAPVFSGISNQDSFSAMSASRTIQAASIFYLDSLLATTSALYTSSCLLFWLHFSTSTFSPITIFCILSYSTPSSRLLGKPCAVSSTSHSPSLLEPVPIQASLTWSHCVSFRLRYSPACNSSQYSSIFYFIDTFSTHIFLKRRQRGRSSTSSPTLHSLLLLECALIVILY